MAGFAFITLPLGLMFFFSGFIINGLQVLMRHPLAFRIVGLEGLLSVALQTRVVISRTFLSRQD